MDFFWDKLPKTQLSKRMFCEGWFNLFEVINEIGFLVFIRKEDVLGIRLSW